jgi:hypothetical protein
MATASNEQILIGVDDEVIELTGADKKAFLAQKAIDKAAFEIKETAKKAKAQAKLVLLEKLGITEDEAKLLLS